MTELTENNAQVGQIYYQELNDAAGYPNGMAYWPELPVNEKYHHAATGMSFLQTMEKAGFITINKPIGFGENPKWGEGECQALLDLYKAKQEDELREFETKLARLRAAFGRPID